MRVSLLLALPLVLIGCAAGASSGESADARDWTYFRGTPMQVVEAMQVVLVSSNVTVRSVSKVEDGVLVTLGERFEGMNRIYIEATTEQGFGARAQLYRKGRPLPGRFERNVRREF